MKNRGKRKATLLLLLFFLLLCSLSADEKTLIFGSVENIEPLSYSENNSAKGLFVDIMTEIAARSDLNISIRFYPFPRLLQYLQSGEIDGVLSIYHRPEREDFLIYSSQPVLVSRVLIFTREEDDREYRNTEDMYGKVFGRMSGWSLNNAEMEEAVNKGDIILSEARDYNQNLRQLVAGRLDGLILTEQLTWFHASQMGLSHQIKPADLVLSESISYLALSRLSPRIENHADLIETINTALGAILTDGTYDELLRRYNLVSLNQNQQDQ